MYKKDFALNDLQWLMCHKTKENPTNYIGRMMHQYVTDPSNNVDHIWDSFFFFFLCRCLVKTKELSRI